MAGERKEEVQLYTEFKEESDRSVVSKECFQASEWHEHLLGTW